MYRVPLVREVWPDPDPAVVERLRSLGLGDYPSECSLGYRSWVEVRENLTVVADYHDYLLVEEGRGGFGFWPPLPDVDPVWKAASMIAALRNAEEEVPLLPVGYKTLELMYGGVMDATGRSMVWPSRIMGPATCMKVVRSSCMDVPGVECECGFHAAYRISDLAASYPNAEGVLIVTPLGRTVWHDNAWRSEYYQVHAAIVPLDWRIPEDWDPDVPIVRARTPLIPSRAYQIAREVKVMIEIEDKIEV